MTFVVQASVILWVVMVMLTMMEVKGYYQPQPCTSTSTRTTRQRKDSANCALAFHNRNDDNSYRLLTSTSTRSIGRGKKAIVDSTSLPLADDRVEESVPSPSNFREAEVLGLKLMQEGHYEEALSYFQQALKLPGSKKDIIRTKNVPGPSPVGGSSGGTQSEEVFRLDEFEYQAVYYNMGCAYAKLNQNDQAIDSLRQAYSYGFDRISTLTSDPDLRSLQTNEDFIEFINEIKAKRKKMFGLF